MLGISTQSVQEAIWACRLGFSLLLVTSLRFNLLLLLCFFADFCDLKPWASMCFTILTEELSMLNAAAQEMPDKDHSQILR